VAKESSDKTDSAAPEIEFDGENAPRLTEDEKLEVEELK
jgi:hypothetical protein